MKFIILGEFLSLKILSQLSGQGKHSCITKIVNKSNCVLKKILNFEIYLKIKNFKNFLKILRKFEKT